MFKALYIVYLNVQDGSRCTKRCGSRKVLKLSHLFHNCFRYRDIFYKDPSLFGKQSVLDKVIDDIALLLQVPRISLHVVGFVTLLQNVLCHFIKRS